MRSVPVPIDTAVDAYTLCANAAKGARKIELKSIRSLITEDAANYNLLASAGQLHQFPRRKDINGVLHNTLKANYSRRMVDPKHPARQIYDRIKLLAAGRCPYCDVGKVKEVDHFLPKSDYSSVIVHPCNLVPCCRDCNREKLNGLPLSPSDVVLHPYFDDVSEHKWLSAKVVRGAPAALLFEVVDSPSFSATVNARIRKHFKVFDLATTYSVMAGTEISKNQTLYADAFSSGGALEVKDELYRTWDACRSSNLNSWRTATYDALRKSSWYFNGGFLGSG